jgi:hypothetical protein
VPAYRLAGMTVTSTSRRAKALGNGSTTSFPFTFKVFDTSDLRVVFTADDGSETDLTLDSHYTVVLNADQDVSPGGTVTYPITGAALAASETLVIESAIPSTQGTDFGNAGRFFPQTHEAAFDRAVALVQQVEDKVGRALVVSVNDTDMPSTLPAAADRANTFLAFDADGNPIASAGTGADAGLRADLAAPAGAGLVGMLLAGTGAYIRTVQSKLAEGVVSITDFIDPALSVSSIDCGVRANLGFDYLASLGGGRMLVPWKPGGVRFRHDTTITIPNHCELVGYGMTDPSGGDGSQFRYQGTGAAFELRDGIGGLDRARGIGIMNIGVGLDAVGATGFRLQSARYLWMQGCAVDMDDDFQTGFHLKGERVVTTATGNIGEFTLVVASAAGLAVGMPVFNKAGTIGTGAVITLIVGTTVTVSVAHTAAITGNVGFGFGGVFDCTFVRLHSYAPGPPSSATNALHYKLSGFDGLGQCNTNTFLGISGGGAGRGIEIGPSYINSFYGVELEVMTGDYITCKAGAEENSIYDLYAGDAASGYAGKIFNCEAGAQHNRLVNYRAGSNVDPQDLELQTNNTAEYHMGDKFVPAGARTSSIQRQAEAFRRFEARDDGLYYGNGLVEPARRISWRANTHNPLALGATVTPNLELGLNLYLDIDANINFTFNEPTGGFDGVVFNVELINNSGGARTITWHANYIRNTYLITSLPTNDRYTVTFKRRGTQYVITGAPLQMS